MEMRGWQDLGVVETIYEEDDDQEEECFNSPSLASSSTATPTPLRSSSLRGVVGAWTRANGCMTDVVIRINDRCFHLHKDPIARQSGYLRRLLTDSADVTVIPPLGLTADAFACAVRSCYGSGVALTPSNLPAVRAAAEWLEIGGGGGGGGDLVGRTEEYFFQEVATHAGRAAAALRSCAALLGGAAAGAAAPLLARCVEALAACRGGGGGGGGDADEDEEGGGWLEEVAAIPPEEFWLVAEAMRARFAHDHDLLYRILDHYLENHRGKLTEEEKSRLCYTINCTKLSHTLFMHLVQNPRLPLRFVVQAMLVEQLNTHRSFFHRAAAATAADPHPLIKPLHNNNSSSNHGGDDGGGGTTTLGAILNRDAALRQSAQLRSSMQATSFRIDGLEREIAALRRCLRSAELEGEPRHASASFRMARGDEEEDGAGGGGGGGGGGGCAEGSGAGGRSGRERWRFGAKLVRGLKSFFRKPGGAAAWGRSGFGGGGRCDGGSGVVGEGEEEEEVVVVVERRPQGHRRNRSLV